MLLSFPPQQNAPPLAGSSSSNRSQRSLTVENLNYITRILTAPASAKRV